MCGGAGLRTSLNLRPETLERSLCSSVRVREMAGMNLNSVGLNESIAHVFRARNILTAKVCTACWQSSEVVIMCPGISFRDMLI